MPEIGTTMQLLHFLAEVFINTFGITQPSTPAQQRRVSLTLGGFLLAFILVVFAIGIFFAYELHQGR
jgi:hypothetical protein